jgi:hypothetical protein
LKLVFLIFSTFITFSSNKSRFLCHDDESTGQIHLTDILESTWLIIWYVDGQEETKTDLYQGLYNPGHSMDQDRCLYFDLFIWGYFLYTKDYINELVELLRVHR